MRAKLALLTFAFLLLPFAANATVWQTNGSQADVQAKHNQAADGDTIVIPAGNFSWTTKVTVTKGVTIQGSTTVNSNTGACNDISIIRDDIVDPQLNTGFFDLIITGNKAARITGLTFTKGARNTNMYNGAIRVGGASNNIRFDHLHFTGQLQQSNGIAIYSGINGVADHIVMDQLAGQNLQNRVFNGTAPYGDQEFAAAAGYGGPGFFFFEDWYVDNRNSGPFSAAGGWDANSSGKYVIRHSQLWNVEILCHGTEGSREHGGRAYEIYNNACHFNYFTGLDGIRSGSMLAHDNTYDGIKPVGYGLQTYRLLYKYGSIWGGANGANNWDYNVTESDGVTHIDGHPSYRFDTGTVTGWTNNGQNGTLTDNSKNWMPHRFRGYEVSRTSDGITFAISDNTATTLSTVQWGDGCCIQNFAAGNTYEIRKSLMCNDQPGLGAGDLISGANPPPAWRHQVREGNYSWNNVFTPTGEHINWDPHVNAGVNGQLVEGLDYHSDTAMPGYAPYVYPHPLTGGQASPTPTAAPSPTPSASPTATPSSTPTATPMVTPTATPGGTPNPPGNLAVIVVDCQTVRLDWQDTNGNEDLTQIYINTNNSGYILFDSVGANIVTKTENGLGLSNNYAFKVRAHNASGYSAYSNISSVTMPPSCATPSPTPSATATATAAPTATATGTATATATVTPTATATASATATVQPSPSATSTPSATATPTPSQCTVPNLIGKKLNRSQFLWNQAGFTSLVNMQSQAGVCTNLITFQSIPAGTQADCTTTQITVRTN